MASQSFQFVVSDGPKIPKDPAVRTLIRKQAMKDIGITRKKKAHQERVNTRQYPVFEDSLAIIQTPRVASTIQSTTSNSGKSSNSTSPFQWSGEESPGTSISTYEWTDIDDSDARSDEPSGEIQLYNSRPKSIPANLSFFPEYEISRIMFGIDVVDLSVLTNFNVGSHAIPIISADPTRLAGLMSLKQWSYLEYVPARYGSSDCLTAATNCLLARVHMVLSPSTRDSSINMCNMLYGKALRSLQKELTSGESSLGADVLAATQLLSLHELLDPTRDTAWSQHINGSARLMALRSPKRFKTDFEKALLASHVGAMVSEALFKNVHCYLEKPEWVTLYKSLAQDSTFLTDRSPLAINLRVSLFALPGVWQDVGEYVNSDELFSDSAPTALEKRCEESHQALLDWLEDYKSHAVRLSLAELPETELSIRRELFGTALECLMIVKRLLATLFDSARPAYEIGAQAYAHLVIELQDNPQPKHSWLFTAHEAGVAQVCLAVRHQWEEETTGMDERSQKEAIRERYNCWNSTLRPPTPPPTPV